VMDVGNLKNVAGSAIARTESLAVVGWVEKRDG